VLKLVKFVIAGFLMTETLRAYVFRTPEGGWRVEGTRVSLDSVVHEFLDGESPETIVEHYPSLALDQVYGAISFYLSHQAEVDAYLKEQNAIWEQLRADSESRNAPLLQRLRDAKRGTVPNSGGGN
jgi:uncharacterized protein (DUF433 family)